MVLVRTSADFSPKTEEEWRGLQSSGPWLECISGLGPGKLLRIVEYAPDMNQLVEAVRTRRIRNDIGDLLFGKISQRLEDQGFLKKNPQRQVSSGSRSLFLAQTAGRWLYRYGEKTGFQITSQGTTVLGIRLDYVLELDSTRIAVVVKHSAKGRVVIDAIGSLAIVIGSGDFTKGIALVNRDDWQGQFEVKEGVVAENIELYFL